MMKVDVSQKKIRCLCPPVQGAQKNDSPKESLEYTLTPKSKPHHGAIKRNPSSGGNPKDWAKGTGYNGSCTADCAPFMYFMRWLL